MLEATEGAKPLCLPVVSAGAEYLVMGYLMRRNTIASEAPRSNEGYDLICMYPDCRELPRLGGRLSCGRGWTFSLSTFDLGAA